MAEDAASRYVAARLAEKRWRQADLGRASGLDKNTISTFMTGKSKPSLATLGKIEDALDLTPGTLAALGEDTEEPAWFRSSGPDRRLARASEEDLLAELTHRVVQMKGELERLRESAEEMKSIQSRREQYLAEHGDDDEHHRSLGAKIAFLVHKSEHDGWTTDDEADWQELWDLVHLEMLLAEYKGVPSEGAKPAAVTPIGHAEQRRQRILEDGQPVETAADDRTNPPRSES